MSVIDFFRNLFKKSEVENKKIVEEPKRPEERFILAIDGGGMRGIIPVVLLKQLEKSLRSLGSDKDISSYFDLIAGTSTGGLISLALSCPSSIEQIECSNGNQVSLEKLLDSYMTMGDTVFQAKASIFGIRQIADNKYHSSGISNYTKKLFGSYCMQQAKVPTLIMAYDLTSGQAEMIRSYDKEQDYPIWVAARSTSAAPTYFEPLEFRNKLLVDGGVIANNPSLYAYLEAKRLYPECEKFHILSLSTGGSFHTMTKNDTCGILSWGNQVTPMFDTAQKRTCDFTLTNLKDVEYLRIDDALPEPVKMDETSQTVLKKIHSCACEEAIKHEDTFFEFAKKLIDNMEYKNASQAGRA